jgi:exodeoxyribonuclease-1
LHVTNISPEQTVEPSLPNTFDFAQTLQEFIAKWSPACWLGYNTIAFDELMMRQMFYQNLQPEIFATQMNGNNRLDVMKMVMATHAEAPDALTWPLGDNGKTSFKLDRLAPANGFAHANAHDALADVEATIFMFHKIQLGAPSLFAKLLKVREKAIILSELKSYLPMEITLRFGGNAPKTYQGCYCGTSKDNSNTIGFADFDLNDAAELSGASELEVTNLIEGSPKKIRTLAVNKSETFRLINHPTASMLEFCETVKQSADLRAYVSQVLSERYEERDDADLEVEEKIYSGFYGKLDKDLLSEFQKASWVERVSIVNSFEDVRLRQLGKRLIAFYAPELLSAEQQNALKEFIRNRWSPNLEKVPWATANDIWSSLSDLGSKIETEAWIEFYEARINYVIS